MGKRQSNGAPAPRIRFGPPVQKRRRPPRHPESDLQISLVEYHRRCTAPGASLLYAVPNGGHRDGLEAARLIQEGVVPGVADLVLLLPGARSIYIEVKTAEDKLRGIKAGVPSPKQKEFQAAIERLGFLYVIVRSPEDFYDVLVRAGVPVMSRPLGVWRREAAEAAPEASA
jgi:hypothetical protein